MGFTRIESVAVYFARGEDMVSCKLMSATDLPQVGSTIELTHTCPVTPDDINPKEKRTYKVVSHKEKTEGADGIDEALEDRNWLEAQAYKATGNEDFFDYYYMAPELGLNWDQEPARNIIVELELVD